MGRKKLEISDEERKAKQKESMKKYYSKPENKENQKERMKKYYSKPENKEKQNERMKKYYSKPENKEKQNERMKKYLKERYADPEARKKIKEYTSKYQKKPEVRKKMQETAREYYHKPEVKKKLKENSAKIKLDVFTHYSKIISNSDVPICACCGYDDLRFLSLDHIDGRIKISEKEKKLISSGLWKYVKAQGFQKGYQVLCHNCNIAKGRGKYCPHQLDKINKKK